MAERLDKKSFEVRYLLGELSEQEEESFEQRYLGDDPAFEELQIAEAEVIDAYVSGELTEAPRKHLEQRLAKSPRLRERVAFARTLADSVSRSSRESVSARSAPISFSSEPWWKKFFPVQPGRLPAFGLAAALAIVLFGGTAVIVQWVRLRNESQRLAVERSDIARQRAEMLRLTTEERDKIASEKKDIQGQSDRAEALLKEIEEKQKTIEAGNRKQGGSVFAFTLFPGSARSEGGPTELKIPPGTSTIQLDLTLVTVDYPSYSAVITGPVKEIQRNRLKPTSSKALSIQMAPSELPPGNYEIKVSGVTAKGRVEPINDYAFRVPVRQ